MSVAIDAAALLVACAGLLALAASAFLGTAWRVGLKMALTLWMAAGLLRLAAPGLGWRPIVASASVVIARQIILAGLRISERASGPTS